MSFACPTCHNEKTVVLSTTGIVRRRMCPECSAKFETTEVLTGVARGGKALPQKVTPSTPSEPDRRQEYYDVLRDATAYRGHPWTEAQLANGYRLALAQGNVAQVIEENLPPALAYRQRQEDTNN